MTSLYTPWGNLPITPRDYLLPVAKLPVTVPAPPPSPALFLVVSSSDRTDEDSEKDFHDHGYFNQRNSADV